MYIFLIHVMTPPVRRLQIKILLWCKKFMKKFNQFIKTLHLLIYPLLASIYKIYYDWPKHKGGKK